jgi:abelson tyrosine-protein kinase 1
MRPSLPPSPLTNSPLMNVIRESWDTNPSNRPSFEQIARDIKKQRTERSTQGTSTLTTDSPKPLSILAQWSAQNQGPPHRSPDILPQPLQDDSSTARPRDSTDVVAETESGRTGSALGLDIGNDGTEPVVTTPFKDERADPPVKEPLRSGSISTSTNTMTSEDGSLYQSILSSGYLGDPDRNTIAAKHCDERRYRMLLQHDYHTIRGYFVIDICAQFT